MQHVFIGSSTNARIEDLRAAAVVVGRRRVAPDVRAMVVPGAGAVQAQVEAEGLADVFKAACFEWRRPGCFMCLAMNEDVLALMLPPAEVQALIAEARLGEASLKLGVDLHSLVLTTGGQHFRFLLAESHRLMLLDGTDLLGAPLAMQREIDAFTSCQGVERPWLRDVARRARQRLNEVDR